MKANTLRGAVCALALGFAVTSAGDVVAQQQGGAMVVTYKDDISTFDPAIGYDWQNWSMIKSLFDGLMDYKPGTTTGISAADRAATIRALIDASTRPSDLARPGKLERLAGLLRKLHGVAPFGAAFDPLAAARRYAAQLGNEQSRSILHRCEKLMRAISTGPVGQALCHNDLVCRNVLEGKRLMLIDWEYAGAGDPFFDLAVVVRHHGLDLESAQGFLGAYLGRSASARETELLTLQCGFYQCLLELWELIYPR